MKTSIALAGSALQQATAVVSICQTIANWTRLREHKPVFVASSLIILC